MVTATFVGVIIVLIGPGLSAYAISITNGRDGTSHVSAACESSVLREVDGMRWMIRDVAIFLYGCVFASKYISFGESHLDLKSSTRREIVRFVCPARG
jgi:hypothetical protein